MKIRCPHCDARLNVRDDLRGRTGACPGCKQQILLEPEEEEISDLLAADLTEAALDKSDERDTAADVDAETGLPVLPALRTKKKKKSKKSPRVESEDAADDEPSDAAADAEQAEEEVADQPKKRRRSSKASTLSMVESVASPVFWRSAMDHLPYMAATLLLVGALLGFLCSLVRSEIAAGIIAQLIGLPTLLFTFLMCSYPMSCVCKVLVGSADGGKNADIGEWPDTGMGAWIVDMLFVGYLVLMSFLLSAGIAKLREVAVPGQLPSPAFWQILGHVEESNTIKFAPKFLGENVRPVSVDVTSSRPVFSPGPAWWTVLGSMIFVLPFFTICCLDPASPMLIPWSPPAIFSLLKHALAWLVVVGFTAVLFSVAAVVFVYGASYAPLLTFTICSPLAACCLLLYARVLGRLAWLIAR